MYQYLGLSFPKLKVFEADFENSQKTGVFNVEPSLDKINQAKAKHQVLLDTNTSVSQQLNFRLAHLKKDQNSDLWARVESVEW
jgi:hypothetical protein